MCEPYSVYIYGKNIYFTQAAAAKKFITSQAYSYIVYVLCNVVFYEIKFDIYIIYICIYIYIYIYIYTHICIYVGPIYIYNIYIYTHIYIIYNIYTHTHKHIHLLLNNWSISCTHILNDKHTLPQLMYN